MFVGQITRQQGRLPVEATGFIGRQAELARLAALLERARLVTVTGPGGIGKTRVALRAAARAAARFADGACLVELSALREPELLAQRVADALGLPPQSPGPQRDAVLAYLRDRQLLLILDTCEHLIDECAVFAEAVIAEAPRVTLLATSREPLDVIGENSCPVPPLPVPPLPVPDQDPPPGGLNPGGTAVELFLERASAAVPGFTVTPAQMRHVIAICDRLDGIPLAIELAAVRLRALSLSELASRLDERLVLLASGQRGGRHKALRDAISWSYDLCTPAEQALWARLSVFAGPVSISAAEEVCAGGEVPRDQVMTTMIRLVDKSVLRRTEPDGDGGGQPTRYQMLDTFREFGAGQLTASGARAAVLRRLIARCLAMARGFGDHFADDDQLDRLRELRREHASTMAALEHALGSGEQASMADGIELAIALFAYWRARGLASEGGYWLGRAIRCAPAGSSAQVRALLRRACLAALAGGGDLAAADAAQSLRLGTGLGDDRLIAHAHLVSNLALSVSGRLAAAAEAGATAGRLLAALDARVGLIDLEIQLTYLALLEDDAEAALEHVERGLRLLGNREERWLHGQFYLLAAISMLMTGRETESTWGAIRSLRVKHEIGDTMGIACTLEILGWLASRSRRHERAAVLLGGADHLWKLTGGRLLATGTLESLHAEAVARSVDAIGDKRYEALFAGAARQRPDQVVAFAFRNADDPDDEAGARLRLPGQLTAREREIAKLVANGLSNRQIAEQLFISRRTVDAHVEHIFGKLGITSRVTLAIQFRGQAAAVHDHASA